MNKTNASTIGAAYGDDTDGWVGKPIILFPTKTQMGVQGMVDCIRIRIPAEEPTAADGDSPF